MSRNLVVALTLAVVLAAGAKGVWARGGGHGGGGHHGGGHHAGGHHTGHHAGNHHANQHHAHHANHHHHAHYNHHGNHPFHHGWYGHHRGAWGGWGWGDWGSGWYPAAFGTAAAWLGLDAAAEVAGGYEPVENVYTSDSDDDADDQQSDADDAAPATDEPASAAEPLAEQARALVRTGAADPPQDSQLLPLGVYSLAPAGHKEATAMLQLSVAKDGVLRGSYYDLLSDKAEPIQGAVDKHTQRVAWSVGTNGQVSFETSLRNLTQETGPLTLHYANGQSRPWTLARYKEEPRKPSQPSPDAPAPKTGEAAPANS